MLITFWHDCEGEKKILKLIFDGIKIENGSKILIIATNTWLMASWFTSTIYLWEKKQLLVFNQCVESSLRQ